MATKTQIGAVISIEGGQEYLRTIKQLSEYTKQFESEMKALTSSFSDNGKSVAQLKAQKETLQKVIASENDKLEQQKRMMEKINSAATDASVTDQKWATAQRTVQTEINNTTANINELKKQLERLNEDNALTLMVDSWKNATSKTGEALKQIGKGFTTYVTLPIVGAAGASVKASADYESAFTGVIKTLDLTGYSADEAKAKLGEISDGIKEMALNTASSSTEIAGVAEIAGQLGVSADDLLDFTRVMVQLGDTTNLSAEDAATALARVMNITGESFDNIENVGSAVVHLGNNFATSESEIVAMSNRLAAGGTLAGLTTQEILGLSAAMSSVGITAEAGGTAMNQTLTQIEKDFSAFTVGAENNFERIAEIAGMSAEDFADAWQNRPSEAVQAFITGLGNLDEKGESATLVLDELGMAGIRQSNMLKSLGLASDVLADAMQKANEGFSENVALSNEANLRYGTFDSKMKQLGESVRQLGIAFGDVLLPMLIPIVEKLTQWITSLSQMDDTTKKIIMTIGGLLAVIGPAMVIVGNILIFVAKFKAAIEALGLVAKLSSLGTTISALVSGPFAWIVAGIAAIVVAIRFWKDHSEEILKFWDGAKDAFALIWEGLKFAFEIVVNFIKGKLDEFRAKVEEIRDKVDNGFRNMVQGARNKFTELQNAVSNVRERIDSTFRNLISNALSWGKDLMNNLISGITSKISSLVGSVKNVASTIWSYLHFSEPEKGKLADFNTWMPDMMSQMAQGINDNLYLIDRAAENVANSLSGGGTSYNYGGVIINLNVPQGANGYQMVDEIENALAQRTLRRKAVFG